MTVNEKTRIKIVGIPGSLREGSHTRQAVEAALRGAATEGAEVELIDLKKLDLPLVETVLPDAQAPAEVLALRKALRKADGIILGTPEYHGSVSGALINALDWVGKDEFDGKAVGLVGVSGGAMGANDALNTLRLIGRNLHAWVVPEQASVPEAWRVLPAAAGAMKERLEGVGRATARIAKLVRAAAGEGVVN